MKDLVKITKRPNTEFILLRVSKDENKSDLDFIEAFSKIAAIEVNIKQPFYYVMCHENLQKCIDQFADSIGAHRIALSKRKHSTFEKPFDSSLTNNLAYQARFPILDFHNHNAWNQS